LNKDIEMETLKIEILNPKAKTLLKGLADLKLINIRKSKASDNYYLKFLERLRKYSDKTPSLAEIQKEVKAVRGKRYGG
jgi:phosphoribosylformylglycinamidine (FGAM) synthase PurS component